MKKQAWFTIFGSLLILLSASFVAENICEQFFPAKEGATLNYVYYDKKDNVTGYASQKVVKVDAYDEGVEVTMQITSLDKKKENPYNGELVFRCEGSKYYVNMSGMMPQEMMDSYKDMEMEMDADYLEYPTNPVAGQTLPDGSATMQIKNGGVTFMTISMDVTDRKVEGQETITTPAGTFSCTKYSMTSSLKSVFTFVSKSYIWMADHVGMIRSEDYTEKGKLRSYQVLTAYTK